jgi:hypothetical protein
MMSASGMAAWEGTEEVGKEAGEEVKAAEKMIGRGVNPPPSRLSTPVEWVRAGGLSLLWEMDPVEATVPRVRPRARDIGEGVGRGSDGDGGVSGNGGGGVHGGGGCGGGRGRKVGGDGDVEGTMTVVAAMAPADDIASAHGTRPPRLNGIVPISCFMEQNVNDNQSETSITIGAAAAFEVWKVIGGRASGAAVIGQSNVWSEYSVSQAYVYKALAAIDVVVPMDHKCNSFTKAYGKYVKGTGSFVANRVVVKSEWDGRVVNVGESAMGGPRGASRRRRRQGGGSRRGRKGRVDSGCRRRRRRCHGRGRCRRLW